jgi:hypothetical protein
MAAARMSEAQMKQKIAVMLFQKENLPLPKLVDLQE